MARAQYFFGIVLLLGCGSMFAFTLLAFLSKDSLPVLQVPLLAIYGGAVLAGAWLLARRKKHG